MIEWLNSLEPALKIYWIIAGIASLLFIIQMILTFIGMDSADDADSSFGGDLEENAPSQFFSIRNLVNFFLGFGWGGVCFYNSFSAKIWVTVFAFLTGICFVLLFFFLLKQFLKLEKNNTFKIEDTINQTVDVYLSIPAEKTGKGKIQTSVKGSFHEINAMTEGEKIPTGSKAKIIEIIDNQTVLVAKI